MMAEPDRCYVVQPVTARQRLRVLGAVPGDQAHLPGRSGWRRCCPRSPVLAAPVPPLSWGRGLRVSNLGPHGVHADAKSGPTTVKQ